jgi:hypothetical protein
MLTEQSDINKSGKDVPKNQEEYEDRRIQAEPTWAVYSSNIRNN